MVRRGDFNGEKAYICEECGLHYREKQVAENCEEHCRTRNACSLEMTRKSLERKRQSS
ncbi:MAG: hypothetical protein ABEJ99_05540 [Candidatus Nanohaloarchaea archaeon]